MAHRQRTFASDLNTLLTNTTDLLSSADARTRVRAIHHLAAGIEVLEHQVLLDAQASGMTWSQIGDVYGVSRQAVHRRFSDETVVPADFFDQLAEDLEQDDEIVETLASAARRARHVTNA